MPAFAGLVVPGAGGWGSNAGASACRAIGLCGAAPGFRLLKYSFLSMFFFLRRLEICFFLSPRP